MASESKACNMLLFMLIVIVVLLMLAVVGLFIRMNHLQQTVLVILDVLQTIAQSPGLEVGATAPDFMLVDVEGEGVTLSSFANRKVLLVFSSVQCPVCTEMYPHLKSFSEQYNDVQVIMISNGTAQENSEITTSQGFEFPVLNWSDEVALSYEVPGTPFIFVIDENSIIISKGFASTLEQLRAMIAS